MPYDKISCDCGEEVETFVTKSDESHGRETCDCGRLIQYKSPAGEKITETEITREVGKVKESDF
jgi:hypothetical protein